MPGKKKPKSPKRKGSPASKRSPIPAKKPTKDEAPAAMKKESGETGQTPPSPTALSTDEVVSSPSKNLNVDQKPRKSVGTDETDKTKIRSSIAKPSEDSAATNEPFGKSASVEALSLELNEAQESSVELYEQSDEDEEAEADENESDEEDIDDEEPSEESESTVSISEVKSQKSLITAVKKKKMLTAEEKLALMYRRDSELTRPQIIEKDILWYDLLTGENGEDLLEPEALVEPEADVSLIPLEEEEEEEEEEASEEGEEEQEAKRVSVESTEEPIPVQTAEDDTDNFASLMQAQDEQQGLELLYLDTSAGEPEVQSLATFPGVVGLNLSEKTLEWFELQHLEEKTPPLAYISFKQVKLHMYIHQEASEFYAFRDLLMHYPNSHILVGLDTTGATGRSHFLCTSLEGRNMVVNPPKAKRKFVDRRKKEEELWKKLMSIVPRKWRTLGSEVEVDLERKYTERPLITMYAYRYIEAFNLPVKFADTPFEGNKNAYAAFESVDPEKMPLLEISEMDVGVQVMPAKVMTSTQTGFTFKRNKICQYENQFVDPETANAILMKPAENLVKKTKALQRALIQNEMMNLAQDDYKGIKAARGHDIEYGEQSVILEEYNLYCDNTHSKGRCVTAMTFHPTLEDVVVVSLAENVTFDKRIDLHHKMLMDPNFVLFWDLKDPSHPQMMLDTPSDVFSFKINPSDPQIICGGCANGQIVLWDLGRDYVDLRARLQDRRRNVNQKGTVGLEFLDKLKDKAERNYGCPLIAPVGLSNLDQSHKRVVTSVYWLPAHVELGKNGNLYENMAGKSYQFFSTAEDGTAYLWDIRPPKLGLDEFEAVESDIRSNVYLHLENNAWKPSNKFYFDDGSGSGALLVSILSLSEPRQGDVISFDAVTHGDSYMSESNLAISSGSGSQPKVPSDQTVPDPEESPSEISLEAKQIALPIHVTGSRMKESVDLDSITSFRKGPGMLTALASVQTSIFIGTTTGQVGLVDWLRNKEGQMNPEAGQKVFYNLFLNAVHSGPITSISRSPFYYNLILVVGGGTISLWKESCSQPILAIAGSDQFPWYGCWSNTRPAVFFVGTREGSLQVWDLTEKGHAPVLLQQISPDRITNVALPKMKIGKKQFLALSDSAGTVFIMLLSGFYYKPNRSENAFMMELMAREEKRGLEWTSRADERREEMETINTAWKESKLTKSEQEVYAIESEVETRLNQEYNDFLEFEAKIGSRLKKEEPSIATDDTEKDFKFDKIMAAAKQREATRGRPGSSEDDDEEQDLNEENNSSEDSPLGSEYDFLLRSPEPSAPLRVSNASRKSKSTLDDDFQSF